MPTVQVRIMLRAAQTDKCRIDHEHQEEIDDRCHLRHDLISRFDCGKHYQHQAQHRHENSRNIQNRLVDALAVGLLHTAGQISRLRHRHQTGRRAGDKHADLTDDAEQDEDSRDVA